MKNNVLCVAPWTNIHVSTTGGVAPCCFGKDLDNVNNPDFEYAKHPKLIEIKKELLAGTTPSYCSDCPEFTWYDEFRGTTIHNDTDFELKSVDVRWSNQCNLSCVYCTANESSTWDQLKNNTTTTTTRKYKSQHGKLLSLIKENNVHRVSLLGGEPLLIKENIALLDTIDDNASVTVFTNLTIDINKSKVYQLLLERNNVEWIVSMETVGERFEFVRRGGEWQTLVNNLTHLTSNLNTTSTVNSMSQFSVYSATNMIELYEFSKQFGDKFVIHWGSKSQISDEAAQLPYTFKQKIQKDIDYIKSNFQVNEDFDLVVDAVNDVRQDFGMIPSYVSKHHLQEAVYFNNRFNFLDLWPQYRIEE